MLYAIYLNKKTKILHIDWTSENYDLWGSEGAINPENITLKFNLAKNKTIKDLEKYDLIFDLGYIIISEKIKNVLMPEWNKKWVQFLDIMINQHGKVDGFYALHVTNHEIVTDFNHSQYTTREGFYGITEYDFTIQQFNQEFEWDLTIAVDRNYPTQIIINDELCQRLIQSQPKNEICFYHVINNIDDRQSVFVTSKYKQA